MALCTKVIDIQLEYSKNENLKHDDMNELRQWVKQYPHFTATSDLILFLCLHSSYYDVEQAKVVITQYNNLRCKWPEIFKNRDPTLQPFKSTLPVMLQWCLKYRTHENYRIFYIKIMDPDTSKFEIYQHIKLFTVIGDLWLSVEGNIDGFQLIFDMHEFSWGHVPKFGIFPIKKLVTYVQDGFPVRLKGIHFIFANAIVDKLLMLAGPFMKKELRSIIHCHPNIETLYKFIPKKCLPSDYGGDDTTLEKLHEDMLSNLEENASMFPD